MRRRSAWCAAFVLVMLLGACGEPPSEDARPPADTLFLRSPRGVAVVEAGAGAESRFHADITITSSDWSTAVETIVNAGKTDVVAFDPSTDAERWRATVGGRLRAKLLSEQGDLVALGPRGERHYLNGRSETILVIAGSGMIEPRAITLQGNYEPEAFSTDGESLFVIEYLPARKPTKYQVRQLDVDTGRVRPVYTPHDELQRPMGGTARIQVASPDGRRLYTLYTVGGNDGYAFIHVLALDDMWAHCIALPKGFARRASSATGLSVSPDGASIYVANSAVGAVAQIDTEQLKVTRSEDVDLVRGGGIRAVHDSHRTVYFASGRDLMSVDTTDLEERARWRLDAYVSGIQPGASGDKIYVAVKREVVVLDADTGDIVETFDPEDVGRIDDLGTGMRSLDSGIVKCAC